MFDLTLRQVDASVFTLNSRCHSSRWEDLAAMRLERQSDLVVLQRMWTSDEEHFLGTRVCGTCIPTERTSRCRTCRSAGTFVYSNSPPSLAAASTGTTDGASEAGRDRGCVAADIPGPQEDVAEWNEAIPRVGHTATAAESEGWPVVVVGDFNAAREHLLDQRLVDQDALADAAEVSGAGRLPTYSGRSLVPAADPDQPLAGHPDVGDRDCVSRPAARAPRAHRQAAGGSRRNETSRSLGNLGDGAHRGRHASNEMRQAG